MRLNIRIYDKLNASYVSDVTSSFLSKFATNSAMPFTLSLDGENKRYILELGYKLREVKELWEEMCEFLQYIPDIEGKGVLHNVFGGQEITRDELTSLLDEKGRKWFMKAYKKTPALYEKE